MPEPRLLMRSAFTSALLASQQVAPTILVLLSLGCATTAAHAETLKNHYNDPFVQVTRAIAACPQPRGPFMTERDARMEAHPRIERGTSCFMAGTCTEPNAYRYDQRIAKSAQDAVAKAVQRDPKLGHSSVWLTVQRRFVFVHGCVTDRSQITRWEALIKAVPEVQYVGVDLAVLQRASNSEKLGRIPYPTMP